MTSATVLGVVALGALPILGQAPALALNGFDLFEQSETEPAEVFERLGSRSIGQGEFFEWVANHVQPLDADGTDPDDR